MDDKIETLECCGGPLDGARVRVVNGQFIGFVCRNDHLTPFASQDVDDGTFVVREGFSAARCTACGGEF